MTGKVKRGEIGKKRRERINERKKNRDEREERKKRKAERKERLI